MISRITGTLERIDEGKALIDVHAGVCYEVHVPACDAELLAERVGQSETFHTIHYLEGDPARGNLAPRLVGFLTEQDREFFRLFTTVKGIGMRKALRALVRPLGEVAAAIQARDARFLQLLPEIGKRTAEQVIAELHGKVDAFAVGAPAPERAEMPEAAAEAVAVLVQLGERRADAMALVQRVLAAAPEMNSPEVIIQHAYRLKAGGI